jgi:hypothetical protein
VRGRCPAGDPAALLGIRCADQTIVGGYWNHSATSTMPTGWAAPLRSTHLAPFLAHTTCSLTEHMQQSGPGPGGHRVVQRRTARGTDLATSTNCLKASGPATGVAGPPLHPSPYSPTSCSPLRAGRRLQKTPVTGPTRRHPERGNAPPSERTIPDARCGRRSGASPVALGRDGRSEGPSSPSCLLTPSTPIWLLERVRRGRDGRWQSLSECRSVTLGCGRVWSRWLTRSGGNFDERGEGRGLRWRC